MKRLPVLLALLIALPTSARAQEKQAGQFTGKLSTLSIPGADLGADWTGPTGLVVDDFRDLGKQPADTKAAAESLTEQVTPLGVVAVADFAYRKQSNPLKQVTLRAFVFDSPDKCRQWWEMKYMYDGWQQHYAVVDGAEQTLDSKEVPKRAVALANVWLTCGSLGADNTHIEILNQYVRRIQSQVK